MIPRETSSDTLFWQREAIAPHARRRLHGHAPAVFWFTGLSGSGKSTLASVVERRLHALGCRTFVLDGDNLRHGLCSDLGFSSEDRRENIRRAGEVASLFVQSGAIVLTALISPFAEDRERARRLVPAGSFFEIHCNASVAECEQRDVKGLYRRARAGEVKEFSGISSPYEPPEAPELVLHTARDSVEPCADAVLRIYFERLQNVATGATTEA
jgi:adenylylsulfate kinase